MASEPDLLIEAGFSDARLAREAQKVIAKYKQIGDAAEKAFKDSTDGVADSQALKAHQRELDRTLRKYDPVYVATKKYEKSLGDLDRALKIGAIDQAKHTAEVSRATQEMAQASGLVQQTAQRAGASGAQFQNVGYQIQDFAVQVGAGTSATQAFAQQFPQLASAFGPWGTALGTAGAILVPVSAALLAAAGNSKTLDDRLTDLEKSTEAMTAAAEAAATPISDLRAQYGGLAEEVARANAAMALMTSIRAQADAIGTAKSLAAGYEDLNIVIPDLDTSVSMGGLKDYEGARQREALIARQRAAMDALRDKTGATVDQLDMLRMALNRTNSSNSLEAVAQDAENLLQIIADLYTGADEKQRKYLDGWASQVMATMTAARQQIAAGVTEENRLFDTYDQNTRDLKRLADDREQAEVGLAKAVQDGNQDKIDSYKRVIEAVDSEVLAVSRNIDEISAKIDGFIERMSGQARRIGGALSNAIEGYLGWSPAEFGKDAEHAAKGILDLIASRESGGDYNATLDNGRWTGGPRDLVNMTLNEILRLQSAMRTPENRALYGNGKGSSALGRYQIVGSTLEGLIRDLGLTGNEMFDPAMQDRLAMELLRQRRGQGVAGLRQEWAGLNNVSPALIQQALGNQAIPGVDPEVERRNSQALKEQAAEQERKLNLARQLSEQLSKNLITEQQTADLARQRNEQVAAINARGMSDAEKAAAIAQVNAEMERQRTIMMLMEDAKRRGVDLDAQMVNSTLTYRDAINQLGDARAQQVIADQQAAAAADRLKQAQDFAAEQTQALKNGIVDAIVEGENFADVLANVAQALAKAALQAALFNEGPMAGGGGLFGFLGSFLGGGVRGNDVLSQALRGTGAFGGFRANGGPVSAGQMYWTGERGPEPFVPAVNGRILSVLQAQAAMRGGSDGGPQTMVIDLRGTTGDAALDAKMRAAGQQILAQAKAQAPGWMSEHQKRNT